MGAITGILMCGGKSTRMGVDKKLLKIRNQPMILNTLHFLEETCAEVLISNNDDKLDFLNYKIVTDLYPNIGPIGGLYSCLEQSYNSLNFVLACDMPMVSGNLFRKLLNFAASNQVVVPIFNKRPEPLYGLYNKSALPTIKQHINENILSLQKLLEHLDVFYFKASNDDAAELQNLNTYTDFLAYEQMAREQY